MVNLFVLVAVPPPAVIDTTPVAAPGITKPTSCVPVFETTMAATPPILNAVGLPKLVPVMVTRVPTGPCAGLNEVIVGPAASNACADNRMKIAASKIFGLISLYIFLIYFIC